MKVRQPKVSIWLYKPRDRQNLGGTYSASQRFRNVRQVDITSHLSDDSGFRTTRSLRDPNGGNFQIVFIDKPLIAGANFGDSLYGLLEPGDFIEIRATGLSQDSTYPLLMRGFVTSVVSSESIESGTPQRQIMVYGYDVQRVLQLLRVRYRAAGLTEEESAEITAEFGIPFGNVPLAAFQSYTDFTGSEPNATPPAQFVQGVVDKLVTPYLAKVFGGTPALAALTSATADCSIDAGFVPPLMGSSAFDGRSVYEVLAEVLDVGPFSELFLEDQGTGLVVKARPIPWVDTSGALIGPGPAADEYAVSAGSLITSTVSRSDAGVANYFWVQRRVDLINDAQRRIQGASGPSSDSYLLRTENANPTAFGWRFMEAQTALTNSSAAITAPTADQVAQRGLSEEDWLTQRRQLLMALNQDNLVFESGTLKLKGDPQIKIGTYLMLTRGLAVVRLYVTAVTHDFSMATGYVTTVTFERGTGWLARASSNGMPWYEWRDESGVN